ncbi:MAG: hypothetical protein ABI430_01360 [Candidatus Taylorbacteria bacterium]
MNELDTKKIESLLEEEKYDEAASLMAEFFGREMTKKEKASFYLAYAGLYLEVMAGISGRYNEALKQIRKNLEEVTAFEKREKDKLNLEEVRTSL